VVGDIATVSTALEARLRTGQRPLVALGTAVLAGSTGAIFVRLTAAPSIVDAFYRLLFTTLLLLPLTLSGYRNAFRSLSRRDLLVATASGVLLAVHFAAWMESLEWTSVSAAAVLVQTQVLFVALGSVLLLNETISREKAVGIGIAFGGVSAMSLSGVFLDNQALYAGANPMYGNLLALLGAAGFAGYLLAGRSVRQRLPLLPYATFVYGVATAVLLVAVLVGPHPATPTAYGRNDLLLFLAMALVPGVFGHTVMNWALKYVESSVVSVTFLGSPLGNTLLAIVFLQEFPGAATLAGGLVVLAGIYQTTRGSDAAGDADPDTT
jgi:drug/metabolite transporter (DMT)-like permease